MLQCFPESDSLSHAHKATVMCVKWNHNGNWLTSAARDHLIKIFDIRRDVNKNRGGIIWFGFTLTKSTITGIRACVSSMSTEGSAAMLIAMTLVLQKLVSSLDADEECAEILLQAWYLDNGALAGTRSAVLRALHLIEELGPALGLHVNLAKCEMFSRRGNTSFPPE
ncbi:hypothetical protein EMCRGX_G016800 [Ephydatia muelleri]